MPSDRVLPPGQRERADLPRFGLPWFATRMPAVASEPRIEVVGVDGERATLTAADLDRLARSPRRTDFHCVSTWSRLGLLWDGPRFRDLYDELIAPRADSGRQARFVRFHGLDGYRDTLSLDDLRADDVIVARWLDDEPLTPRHGAPVRLVAPAHYGYKSVKHLCRIELRRSRGFRWPLSLKHPRARVEREERFVGLPARLVRSVYRPIVRPNAWWFRRTDRSP